MVLGADDSLWVIAKDSLFSHILSDAKNNKEKFLLLKANLLSFLSKIIIFLFFVLQETIL